MNYFRSMLQVLGNCVSLLLDKEPGLFAVTLLAGIVLAALCWWAATHYSRLFNLKFEITGLHRLLCAAAALLTLSFWLLFVSLQFTKQIAQDAIDAWYHKVSDNRWRYQVSTKIYYAIKATGEEDFGNFPPPAGGSFTFPLSKPISRHLVASLPANEALHMFQTANPYLSHVLSLPSRIPDGAIVNDVEAFFLAHPGKFYPTERAVNLVATEIKGRLDPETPKAVSYARLILSACFLLAQAVPFGWIGFAAYQDLKVGV